VPGVDLDRRWISTRTLENDFLQDREMMAQGNFTGITGIPNQDIAMWVSMGRRVERHSDTLGASDLAIVEFRRLMVDAARKVAEGGRAIGTGAARQPQAAIASREGLYPKEIDWRDLPQQARTAAAE
jgi:phthalate 4,5-dioxygenase oxygenase subunit